MVNYHRHSILGSVTTPLFYAAIARFVRLLMINSDRGTRKEYWLAYIEGSRVSAGSRWGLDFRYLKWLIPHLGIQKPLKVPVGLE
jgi:hypothetical protein